MKAATLTARALGDYGADETHTLTAGESGAGPHYHAVDPQPHVHTLEKFTDYNNGTDALGAAGNQLSSVYLSPRYQDLDATTDATTSTIKASGSLDVEGTDETDSDAFRVDKTDLNTGVPAVSGHTQMQPFVVINYIIKY